MFTSNGYQLDESPERLGWLDAVPDEIRGDRDALWTRLRRDGYLFLPGLLDPELVRAFRAYYFEQLTETGLIADGTDPRDGIGASGEVDRAILREALVLRNMWFRRCFGR